MGFLMGIVQIVCFVFLVKIGQILFWNLRKSFHIHPVLLETVLAVVLVLLFHWVESIWALLIFAALSIGVIRGDQEELSPGKQLY